MTDNLNLHSGRQASVLRLPVALWFPTSTSRQGILPGGPALQRRTGPAGAAAEPEALLRLRLPPTGWPRRRSAPGGRRATDSGQPAASGPPGPLATGSSGCKYNKHVVHSHFHPRPDHCDRRCGPPARPGPRRRPLGRFRRDPSEKNLKFNAEFVKNLRHPSSTSPAELPPIVDFKAWTLSWYEIHTDV